MHYVSEGKFLPSTKMLSATSKTNKLLPFLNLAWAKLKVIQNAFSDQTQVTHWSIMGEVSF